MSIDIVIERSVGRPLYRQIAEQIQSMIVDGRLSAGASLPGVRRLATKLEVAPLTVFQAYEALRNAGLVVTYPGKGTAVASQIPRKAATKLLSRVSAFGPMNEFEVVSDSIGIRSLASSVPDPEFFMADEFLAECSIVGRESPWMFYYPPPAGSAELLEQVCSFLQGRGISSTARELAITSGGDHARSLVLNLTGEPGDRVLIEDPAALGGPEFYRNHRMVPIGVPVGVDGMDLDAFEAAAIEHKPKFAFVSPTFGPTHGRLMPAEKRVQLLELCRKYEIRMIEEGNYSLLSLDGPIPPAIAASDDEVVYIESFAYSLTPGLRLGIVRAPHALRDAIVGRLNAVGGAGPLFVQTALARYLKTGRLQSHLTRVIPKVRARRDALLAELDFSMPEGVTWTRPQGGFSTWVTLPSSERSDALFQKALERGVAFAPGRLFSDSPDADWKLRLAYGMQNPEALRQAIETLARLLKR